MSEAQVFELACKKELQLIRRHNENKVEHVVRMWGAATMNPLFIGRYGKPNEHDPDQDARVYVRWFDTPEEVEAFRTEVKGFLKLLNTDSLVFSTDSGTMTRKRTVAVVTLEYKGKEYVVRETYGYGYPMGTVIFNWEENNNSCDCNRLPMIERQHPGTVDPKELEHTGFCKGDGCAVVKGFQFVLID